MRYKKGATFTKLKPQAWYAVGVAEAVYRTYGLRLTVTCGDDSHEHKPQSLHNKGLAVDLRTRNVPAELLGQLFGSLKNILNPMGYDLVREDTHIHVEFDPKTGETWLTEVS